MFQTYIQANKFSMQQIWPRGYKSFFMLNPAEHEIFPARKMPTVVGILMLMNRKK